MRGYSIIKKRSDFLAANRGKRYATPGFVLLVRDRQNDDPVKRLGITITKKVGNAVVRNRMRRRFRELAREMLGANGKAGADHILIGRDGGIEMDFAELRADMARALGKLCGGPPLPFRGGIGGGAAKSPRDIPQPHPNPSPEGEGL